MGLTGLEIEAAVNTHWSANLSTTEAVLACRYASHELNGFPVWLPKLFDKYPNEVADFFRSEIIYELRWDKEDRESHYALDDLSWSGDWMWDAIAPKLLAALQTEEPKNFKTLEKLQRIIQGATSIPDADLALIARRKALSLRRNEHASRWFSVWAGVDPANAIPALARRLDRLEDSQALSFAMDFVQNLTGGRTRSAPKTRTAFHQPTHLKDLILLMNTYICRHEDIDRSGGGVYSPGARDEAQEARDSLLNSLQSIPGKEAYNALEEISRLHPHEASRSYVRQHALARAQSDADLPPWSAQDVVSFNDELERTPSDHRSLAELVVARLVDIKDELEDGDTSLAKLLLAPSLVETDVRLYFARELRDKAKGRYNAPQEEELADAKRPDFRIHGQGFDEPVPVELKLADNWTGSELFERFRNQLGGDYLRDKRSSRGVFLLVWRGQRKSWTLPNRKSRVSFRQLVEALQSYWLAISSEHPDVDDLKVISIDLTKRYKASEKPIKAI